MKGPQVTLTNGRYEFRAPTGGRLALADRPEAGRKLQNPVAQEVGQPIVLPQRDRRPACDRVPMERGPRR